MPCARFGPNVAWLRLAVFMHSLLTGQKRVALKPGCLRARPKILRFRILSSPGRLIRHAQGAMAKVQRTLEELAKCAEARAPLLPA